MDTVLELKPENFRTMLELTAAVHHQRIEETIRLAKRHKVPPQNTLKVELGAPLSDDELRDVEKRLGFALDPGFVALFRSANGFRVTNGPFVPGGRISVLAHVRPLRELFFGEPTGKQFF